MRRTFRVVVVCAAALALGTAAASAQTVDEIVARNIEAKGGLAKIKALQAIRQTSDVVVQGAFSGTLVVTGKRPNMARQDLTVNVQGQTFKVINAFDGTAAWGVNPLNGITVPTAVTGAQAAEIKRQSDFDGELVDYKAKGSKLELVGTEPAGAGSEYHLRLTDSAGQQTQIYLDTKTALETRLVRQVPEMGVVEQRLSDYRDVEGLKMPFSISTTSGGASVIQVTVQKIEINPTIDASFFTMPAK